MTKVYRIKYEEVTRRYYEVRANSKEEAIQGLQDALWNNKIDAPYYVADSSCEVTKEYVPEGDNDNALGLDLDLTKGEEK